MTTEIGVVAELGRADLGKKIRVRDYQDRPFIGVLDGIEIYAMPRRTILHLDDGWSDVYVHPDFPVQVVTDDDE